MTHQEDPFELDDFIVKDPFYQIYLNKRDESNFFYIHSDYSDYMQYLNIIWSRIKETYRSIGIIYRQEMDLVSKQTREKLSEEEIIKLETLATHEHNQLPILGCDIETFILFARRFLDKVGKLVEALIILKPGTYVKNSFTKHKSFFIDNSNYNENYSRLLKEQTSWYEQDLLIWRDGIFVHGKTLNTGWVLSLSEGILIRKAIGVYQISIKDTVKFLEIRGRYPDLKITENPFMMIDNFRNEISRHNIVMDQKDTDDLKDIISKTGTTLNISEVAKNIKNYVEKTAMIFNAIYEK
jgi:hypothetical protein